MTEGGKISWGMKFLPANQVLSPVFLVRKYCYHRALYPIQIYSVVCTVIALLGQYSSQANDEGLLLTASFDGSAE